MKLLFITEVCPFPVFGGEKLRIYGLLRIFEKLNINTVAIIGKSENEKFKDYQFEHIDFIEFDFTEILPINRWKRAFLRFYKDRSLLKAIENILPDLKPDFIYIEPLFYGQYIKYFKKREIPVIYGTHNVQSELFLQRPFVSLKHRFSNILFPASRLTIFSSIPISTDSTEKRKRSPL